MAIFLILILLTLLLVWFFFTSPKISHDSKLIINEVVNNDLPELVNGEIGIITNTGYEIWYECITPQVSSDCDTIIFLFGAGGSALEWSNSFLQNFVDKGYRVIRFDQRDTGLSKAVTAENSMYTMDELAQDVVFILDKCGVEKAHIIGLSMGGMVAQEVAIQFSERVKSLTLIMTTGNVAAHDLPTLKSSYIFKQLFTGLPILKYRLFGGEKNLIKERISKLMLYMNESDINIRETAELVLYDLRKRNGVSIKGAIKHQKIVSQSKDRYSRIKDIDIPTLVVHGTSDPIIPIEHGKKLSETIKGASVLWLEDVGHIFPFPDMKNFTLKLLKFFERIENATEIERVL